MFLTTYLYSVPVRCFEKVNLKKSTDDKKGREKILNMQRNDLFLFNLQFLFMLLCLL